MGEHVKIHIVTAGYLRRFTTRCFVDPQIAAAAEQRLSRYESGLRSLRKIDTTWPLESDELFEGRLHIACLVAIHMLRNEAFKQHTARLQARSVAQRLPEYGLGEAREETFCAS